MLAPTIAPFHDIHQDNAYPSAGPYSFALRSLSAYRWGMLVHFLLTCLIIEATPGPNMGYLTLLSATEGRRAGFITVAGIGLGLLGLGLAAAFGMAALMAQSALIYQALRGAGIAYLLWLAWDAWRSARVPFVQGRTQPLPRAQYFRRGLITNLLNPKAAAFYVTVLPEFIDSAAPQLLQQTLLLTVIYAFIATAVHGLIVLAASQLTPWLAHPRHRALTQRSFALLLAGIALWLGYSTR